MNSKHHRQFRRIALITIVAVYILIGVGSMVRSTGAGMGCPDWPTCFGRVIPPTDVTQLPHNYQEIYRDRGYADVKFNALKTWTEFLNRLTGVTIGFLSLWTLWAAFRIRHDQPPIFWFSFIAFLLVGFNGWMGKVVVASNLNPAIITTHMMASLLVVVALVLAISHSMRNTLKMTLQGAKTIRKWLILGLSLTILQIALGVQVRTRIDWISEQLDFMNRANWVGQIGSPLVVHILGAVTLSVLIFWLGVRILTTNQPLLIQRLAWGVMSITALQLVIGMSLTNLGFPAFLQPLHLMSATIIFGLIVTLFASAQRALSTLSK
jgi:cytochrome c oxidase assembly protein subunit 15